MPIIPFITKSAPLGELPGPVLDRNRRPTVDNRGLMQANQRLANSAKMPDLPADKLAAPYEALGAVGRALVQGGSVMGALAIKMEGAQTVDQVSKIDSDLDQLAAQHKADRLKNNIDPSKWLEDVDTRIGGYSKALADRTDLTPEARRLASLRLTRFTGQMKASVLEDSAKAMFGRAKSAVAATVSSATEAQNPQKLDDALRMGESEGYLQPHEVQASREEFTKVGERKKKEAEADAFDLGQNNVLNFTSANGEAEAYKALDSGTFGNFDPVAKEKLRTTIRQAGNQRASESMDELTLGISQGGITSAARIDQLAKDDPHLTPQVVESAKRYLLSRDALAEKADRETNGVRNAVEMRQAVKDYDPAKDKDRTKYFELVKTIGSRVDQSMAGELTGELYRKYGTTPPKLEVRPEIQRNASKVLDVLFDAKTGAVPWKIETPKKDAKGRLITDTNGLPVIETKIDKAAQLRAINAQSEVEKGMNDWFRLHPGATVPDVQKKLNELIPEGTRAGALDTLRKLLPPVPVVDPTRARTQPADAFAELPEDASASNSLPLFENTNESQYHW